MHIEIKLLFSNCLLRAQFTIEKASIVKDWRCPVLPRFRARVDDNIAGAISFILAFMQNGLWL